MPIVPLHGHDGVRERLLGALDRDALPASLLFTGPRGIGKQRLALWLAQAALCEHESDRPCGTCRSCRFASTLTHPDLHWFFPRPRPKNSGDFTAEDARADIAEAIADRVKQNGLYPPPESSDAIFISTVRAIVQLASISPAIGRRKVFVIGEADRMSPVEGGEAPAANAFLKLLEEPLADTLILLTSSEPGALLPTIRSRVVCVRVAPLRDDEVRAFLADPIAAAALPAAGGDDRVLAAGGAPGTLLGSTERRGAAREARRLLDTAMSGTRADRMRFAFARGAAGARGAFSDLLDELTIALRDVAAEASRAAAESDPRATRRALGASRGVVLVEQAKARAEGNVSPQLVTARLVRDLAEVLA